jgi:predicted transglutaminase-like cysteine proteinase
MSVGRGFAAGVLLLAAATAAQARDVPEMPLGRAVTPPAGYEAFCQREPQDCPAARGGAGFWSLAFGIRRPRGTSVVDPPSSIRGPAFAWRRARPSASFPAAPDNRAPLSRESIAVIEGVNRQVNGSLASASDWKIYGRRDYWAMPLSRPGRVTAGDCEDFVMEKRHRLLAAGFPMAQLSIALLRTGWGETHAVLLVETDEGALVLDNRSNEVRPWWRLRERWIMRQSPDNPAAWVAVIAAGADRRAG